MVDHVSYEQVRAWLDTRVVSGVDRVDSGGDGDAGSEDDGDGVAFNLKVTLSRLPIHLIKEETMGPIRIVGREAFDTEASAALLADGERRRELLGHVGPVLAGTPGFYTFMDEEGRSCQLRDAETVQLEQRLYPDGASQQALMDGLMDAATAMRYLQNVVAAFGDEDVESATAESTAASPPTGDRGDGADGTDDADE
ncbi:hypothetical protein ACFQE1_17720 [Halobium palmae]|uniref:Uncharacterized protein n=1 Tax=Halobium palmae TaxID=1776492 RepID=A0ABD5S4Q9_9EURY